MIQPCYTYRIRITNRDNVQVEKYNPSKTVLGEPSGDLDYAGETKIRIQELHQAAYAGELTIPEVKELGERLFNVLFDEGLRRDFFELYKRARREKALLRIELDVNERQLPDVAALPWEFMRVPSEAGYGTVWIGTDPKLIFSRRRARWTAPEPIQLRDGERLRIALAVAAPTGLGPVKYEKVWDTLQELASKQANKIELPELVNPATTVTIDALLAQEPHIFHFIGHARFRCEGERDTGQVALIDDLLDEPMWIGAERFSELFTRHQPGVVVLQACEGAALSASEAFVGVASQLVQQDIPVVVAMQYEVSNSTARRFALEFYRRLSEDESVDVAAQEGRRRISLGPVGYAARDFATPVLFMRVQDGYLFQRQTAHLPPRVSHKVEQSQTLELSQQLHVVASTRGLWQFTEPDKLVVVAANSTATYTGEYTRPATGIGQVSALVLAVRSLGKAYGDLNLRNIYLSTDQLQERLEHDLLLLGGPKNNQITARFLELIETEQPALQRGSTSTLIWREKSRNGWTEHNAQKFHGAIRDGNVATDFGLIIRMQSPFASCARTVVLFSGSHTFGTIAAAKYFTENILGEPRLHALERCNVVVLVSAQVMGGYPTKLVLEKYYEW